MYMCLDNYIVLIAVHECHQNTSIEAKFSLQRNCNENSDGLLQEVMDVLLTFTV